MRVTLPAALGLLFIGLRLTGYIAWSWWLVLLPFYLLPAIWLIATILCAIVGWILWAMSSPEERARRELVASLKELRRRVAS